MSKQLFFLGDSYGSSDDASITNSNNNLENQLRIFVSSIVYHYKDVSYHNFEHACEVLVSADNMISQLEKSLGIEHKLNAWAKFTIYLAAIIGDVRPSSFDGLAPILERQKHWGHGSTTNTKDEVDLVTILEGSSDYLDEVSASHDRAANKYNNSLEIAWCLLMEQGLQDLRMCLCTNQVEYDCFRQLLVNLTCGADISCPLLAQEREQRWVEAFSGSKSMHVHERAASVLEHIIVAAQWMHTMQHWETYLKWTTRLYLDLCSEYSHGKIKSNPTVHWYPQELLLFQKAIIPLCEKLQSPDVLGAMGSEFYKYATENCNEWTATQEGFATRVLADQI